MQIPVLIEPIAQNGFRATCGEPLPATVEAATRDEALAKLREQLKSRLQNGTQLVSIDLSDANPWLAMASLELTGDAHPLAKFVGMFKDDPLIEEWKQAVADYRRSINDDPDAR